MVTSKPRKKGGNSADRLEIEEPTAVGKQGRQRLNRTRLGRGGGVGEEGSVCCAGVGQWRATRGFHGGRGTAAGWALERLPNPPKVGWDPFKP